MSGLPYKIVDEGLRLHVLITPKAHLDVVSGCETILDDRDNEHVVLRVKVRAIADKGLANKAVIKVVAKWLGVAKSSVQLISGSKSRYKTLLIEGAGADLALGVDQCLALGSGGS